MKRKSKYAGKTVEIIKGEFKGQLFEVEDWWENIARKSWMFCDGNPACIKYAIRSAREELPLDNDVLYGKIGMLGHLIHISEIKEKEGEKLMYYLLDNGRVLTNKDIENWKDCKIINNKLVYDDPFNTHCKTEIKDVAIIVEQSENVFDLVKVGDLLKVDTHPVSVMEVRGIKKDYYCSHSKRHIDYDFCFLSGGITFTDLILAIYKKDKMGNYIKVWEKEK